MVGLLFGSPALKPVDLPAEEDNNLKAFKIETRSLHKEKLDGGTCTHYKLDYRYPHIVFPKRLMAGQQLNQAILRDLNKLTGAVFNDPVTQDTSVNCTGNATFMRNPEVYVSRYQVLRNTADFVSIAIFYEWKAGNGDGAQTTDVYTYNLDLRTGQLVAAHNLLDTSTTGPLLSRINKELKHQNLHSFTGSVKAISNVAVSDTAMRVYISGVRGNARQSYHIDLPFTELKAYMQAPMRRRF